MSPESIGERTDWEKHWHEGAAPHTALGRIASLVRRQVLSRAVRHYARRYFRAEGIFVECGCGTGQASARIERGRRRLIALDFSTEALRQAARVPVFTGRLQADIRNLPIADGSIDGIWNLGVLEHFDAQATAGILSEFRRVLRPGGMAILFWPPDFGSSRWVLAPTEGLISRMRGRPFRLFPDEVNRLGSRRHAAAALAAAGFETVATDFTARDAFVHVVVVARKPAP
ncbi:MAG TPA: class I SAM-dependent methyltransferase [Thermoanaerobaculia bacterium]|nr:class I SAM-dependent methyltransferase [Thermoanaerobaculia bacterium]